MPQRAGFYAWEEEMDPEQFERILRGFGIPIMDIKPGDQVKLAHDHTHTSNGQHFTIPQGSIVTIGDETTIHGFYYYSHPDIPEGSVAAVHWGACEPVTEPHKCTCPAENFFFNGRGCVCGGI